MNEWIARAFPHSFCVLPSSAENGEKEEVPEPPPEPPKKTAPPPPPPKKEEAGGGGSEFWGELEVQRVKFLVRTPQGLAETSSPQETPQCLHSTSLLHPVLELTCARLIAQEKPGWPEGTDVPSRARTWSEGSILGGPPLGPSASPC